MRSIIVVAALIALAQAAGADPLRIPLSFGEAVVWGDYCSPCVGIGCSQTVISSLPATVPMNQTACSEFIGSITLDQPDAASVRIRLEGTVEVIRLAPGGPPPNIPISISASWALPDLGTDLVDFAQITTIAPGGAPNAVISGGGLDRVFSARYGATGIDCDVPSVFMELGGNRQNTLPPDPRPEFVSSGACVLRWPAGDTLEGVFNLLFIGLDIDSSDGTVPIDETVTIHLETIPEPSTSLMLPTGIGALMVLGKGRR